MYPFIKNPSQCEEFPTKLISIAMFAVLTVEFFFFFKQRHVSFRIIMTKQ